MIILTFTGLISITAGRRFCHSRLIISGYAIDFTAHKCDNQRSVNGTSRSNAMSQKKFDITDLERWQKKGILTAEQVNSIVAEEDMDTEPLSVEEGGGLNLSTVVYYLGGFLALFSFTFYIAINWADFSDWARFGVSLGLMLVVGALGAWLRFVHKYQTAGGLLLFVATAIFPIFVSTVVMLMGSWFDDSTFYELRFILFFIALASFAVSVGMLVWSRFNLISLIAAGLLHFMILDIAQMIGGEFFPSAEVSAAISGAFILFAIWLTLRGHKQYTFWFKLYGLTGLLIAFTGLFAENPNVFFGLLYLLVYLAFIGISIKLREAIFLVFGAIGFYIYVFRLTFDYFGDTAYFPLILGIVGVSVIVLAVVFQKYGWRLFQCSA